ncbi:MAG: DUF1127 domain-containing protein [Proteobacteria bacterium]|nr:DUF1127 domain-containing protein [Pseudomonadota bacterium]MBS0546803.1 DUF1127 domain-containing protein [Pseudomonadota bacterium]
MATLPLPTGVAQILGTWRQRTRERRELALLDARSLHDLGLNAGSVQFEINKPFWRS